MSKRMISKEEIVEEIREKILNFLQKKGIKKEIINVECYFCCQNKKDEDAIITFSFFQKIDLTEQDIKRVLCAGEKAASCLPSELKNGIFFKKRGIYNNYHRSSRMGQIFKSYCNKCLKFFITFQGDKYHICRPFIDFFLKKMLKLFNSLFKK